MNRTRRFVLGGLLASGALVVGWGVTPPRQRLRGSAPALLPDDFVGLNGWVAIGADGTVAVVVPRSEMGQGVHTALPMLVAEELDIDLAAVVIRPAPIDKIFANVTLLRENLPLQPDDRGAVNQGVRWVMGKVGRELGILFTGGSTSVRDAWLPMREAGAVARAMLVAAAAERWQVDAGLLHTKGGSVHHPDGRSATYAALAARAAVVGAHIAAGDVRLKDPRDFTLIGTPARRRDSAAKVNGSAIFGIDARPPGLLYAAVVMAPVFGARVASFDAAQVLQMAGVVQVVDYSQALGADTGAAHGVAVLATSWWLAQQAAAALPVTWVDGAHATLSTGAVFAGLAHSLGTEAGHIYAETGEPDTVGVTAVHAEYRAPFLAHVTMEPVNCTAQVAHGKVRLWASTQVPSIAVDIAAGVAGVTRTDVGIEVLLLGGGFGRRLETDMVAQAVAIAMQAGGRPVQLIWSRADDLAHDVYRPAALARFSAQLNGTGDVVAWHARLASGAIGHQYFPRNLGLPGIGPDKTTVEGAYDLPYAFANRRIAHVAVDSDVPLGYWRSVGHSHNAFFTESFIEEVAHAAGRDSVALRRALLAGHPRHLAVLDAALARAGTAPAGRAHGVALHQSFGSIVAQVAEVSVDGRDIRVHRVVCAIDCGIVVNPNIVEQQMASGVIFGLSAALGQEITIRDGRVQQSNFHDFPVLRIDRAPVVDTVIVASAGPPEGVGEPGTPPIAPALAAAVFKLTGQRLRSLPLRLV